MERIASLSGNQNKQNVLSVALCLPITAQRAAFEVMDTMKIVTLELNHNKDNVYLFCM